MRMATLAGAAVLLCLAAPAAEACACGCGVFEVGAGSAMLPAATTSVFLKYDFLDQDRNWSGTRSAPADDNDDKRVQTGFFTIGGQYRVDEHWAVQIELPVWDRLFKTDTGSGVGSFRHTALGDIRLTGSYSWNESGAATGVLFGLKLPSGDFGYAPFDRDVSIGTGSTDALLGLYHSGPLSEDGRFVWYGHVLWDKPLAAQDGYMPGSEFDAAAGFYYAGFALGEVGIAPMLQGLLSARARDGGIAADRPDTGYTRLFLSPGLEFSRGAWSLYGSVQFPVYQNVNGNQLVGRRQFSLLLDYALED